ncbi:hypothetical protein JVT61DRAFT_15397 [Boletus reticuloceps]|uniref:H-type lectin domain-containing protein n=1 Tax=Boletus reticuloceps TaxID=495285 RepID=A0A8I2YT54_9AGAM|nr:hypothetical protein JVT61DRAFT_15397 [Boletus reticuloceps]
MPVLCKFDTQTIHPSANPQTDTRTTVCFPRQLVARPRLSHGIRALDVDKNANIRIRSTLPYFTNTWVDCHVETWCDTTLYWGIDDIFVLTPADLDFLTGEHMRESHNPSTVRINFERPFVTPPKVVVFLNLIDLDNNYSWRLSVSASNIDRSGFTLHIETWGDTILYYARACWIAYPEDREHIFSTSVNTMDLNPGSVTKPQPKHSRDITFDTVGFWKNPSVFVALNFLDVDCKANLRINSYVDGVTKTGLACHIDSWDDTVLYAAGVSIIAFI